jgi:hypothetical protein
LSFQSKAKLFANEVTSMDSFEMSQSVGQVTGTPRSGPDEKLGGPCETIGGNSGPVHTTTKIKRIQRWGVAIFCLLFACVGGAYVAARWALEKTREVPDFYRQAIARVPDDAGAISRQLESEVLELKDQVGHYGSWRAVFTEEQINAWLVHQLPQEYSKVLPKGVCEPRVVIQDGKVLAAARYSDPRIDTVVSFEVTIQLTAEPNVLAVEVRNLRAGALPLPLNHFVHHISHRAASDSLEVRWDAAEPDGIPIGLITVPSDHPKYVRTPVIVESVEFTEGRLWLAGRTGPEAVLGYQPRGPVYRLASMRTESGTKEQRELNSLKSRL